MAFSVTFYENFKKKTNSTKIPDNTVTQRTFQNVEIKEQSSLINPVIKFLFDGSAKFMEYNYAYIPYFNRYYFIDNIVYNSGRYEAYLTCDVLASYKTDIGNSTQYVLRSSNTQNEDIEDFLFPLTNYAKTVKNTFEKIFASKIDDGVYIVGIVNSATNTRGCTSYYAMTNTQFRTLSNFLLSDPSYMNIDETEISKSLQKALINPMQYITEIVWLPIKNFPVGNSQIKVGWWDTTGVTGGLITGDNIYSFSFDLALSKHPQTAEKGSWVNGNTGTQITLKFPPFGKIAIDAGKITKNNYITVTVKIDVITGNATLAIYGKKNSETVNDGSFGGLLYFVETNIGVAMSVNSVVQNSSFYSFDTLINTGVALYGSNRDNKIINNLSAITGANYSNISGIVSALIAPNYSSIKTGGNGSIELLSDNPEIIFDFFLFAEDFNGDFGRPLCEPHTISDLPGFILCSSNDIEIAGTREESEKIGNYLTGGFFYE